MATPTTLPATFVSGNVLTAAQMNNLRGAFRVLQVVSTAKTDTFTTTSTTFTDVTGLTATITPSATSSKILIVAMLNGGAITSANNLHMRLARGGTAIFVGDAAGSRTQATGASFDASLVAAPFPGIFLDSPSTTSATTYSIQVRTNVAAQTAYVNRTATDTDNAGFPRLPSSITVMEISA